MYTELNINTFMSLPDSSNYEGKKRRVGIEVEYAKLSIDDCAKLVVKQFGGRLNKVSHVCTKICDTKYGEFIVELDADWIKHLQEYGNNSYTQLEVFNSIKEWVNSIAESFVPFELVTPPIPVNHLAELEILRENMRKYSATGTEAELHNAFGVHFNPEVKSFDKTYILRILQSFLLLYPWLVNQLQVDLLRRILTYIDPFSEEYLKCLLQENYETHSQLSDIVNDYVEYNPTRNRALDMLPLFSYLKYDSVKKANDQHLIKPRPTFHYRLPNCDIDTPEWRLSHGWNSWVLVESMAHKNILKNMIEDARENVFNKRYPGDPFWVQLAEKYINLT